MMKTKITYTALLATCALSLSSHAATIVSTLNYATIQRIHDTDADGLGNSAFGSPANNLVGYFTSAASVRNMHMVWSFQMTGAIPAGGFITGSDFSVTQTGAGGGTHTYDIEAHIIRTSGVNTILASDYQTTAGTLMTDFDAPGNGLQSLDVAGQDSLTSYLVNNWVENEYIFIGLKTNPITLPDGANDFYSYQAGAQLTIAAVPEPSSTALLGLGALGLMLRRKRS